MRKTLVMLKPDAVKKGNQFIIDILSQLTAAHPSLRIMSMYKTQLMKEQAERLYKEHKDKDFFNKLIKFTISGPVMFVVVATADDEIDLQIVVRNSIKKIREKHASKRYSERNIIHGSDSASAANRELKFFNKIVGEKYATEDAKMALKKIRSTSSKHRQDVKDSNTNSDRHCSCKRNNSKT